METKNTITVSKVLRVMDSSSNDSDRPQRTPHAAHHRFSRLGLRAPTMDDLARDLGVSKKTLYVHFPSKSVIAEQIVDFIGRTMRSRFDKILDDSTLSLAQKLCAIVEVIGANCLGVANLWDHVRDGGALGGDHPEESLVKGTVAIHSNSG